ncbi:MAG: energy transducer TonB [Bryobacterales bacterium]|nr:energy transducer TonB [Bryobacterales bacterium]
MRVPSWAGSVLLHIAGIAALFLLRQTEVLVFKPSFLAPPPKVAAPLPPPPRAAEAAPGGGGGEARPASRGHLPRLASVVFIRPVTNAPVLEAALPMEAGPVTSLASMTGGPIGVPFGVPGPPSLGPGKPGGMGGGDEGRNVYAVTAVSTPPVLVHKVDPEYSEEARKARFNGSVVLRVIIDERGLPTNIEVVRAPGLGLEQRAVDSVSKWRFRPGRRDGQPVRVWATVEVNFSLL